MKLLLLIISFSLLPCAITGRGAAEDSFSGVRDLAGKKRDPFQTSAKTVVLIFVDVECPISNKQAPEVNRVQKKHAGEDVQFWLVYPQGKTTTQEISKHLEDYGYRCAALRDPQHELVKKAGVKVTPEAVVFHKSELIYRGRIDDRHPALGVTRKEASAHDLEQILDDLASGKKVSFTSRPAVGCFIEPDLKK